MKAKSEMTPSFDLPEQPPKKEKFANARRQATNDFGAEIQQANREVAKKKQEGLAPERMYEPRCVTCKHPFRDWIELMLIKGMPYQSLGDRVSPKVDRRSLSNHHKQHMDLQDTAIRFMLEREAKLEGRNFEEGVEDLITKRGVLEVMVRKGYEDIINGVTTVEPRDLVQITKLLADMDTHQYTVGLDEMRAQMAIFIQAIKDVVDPETQGAIAERVKQLRKREGMSGQIEQQMERPQITDAEVVEV